MMTFWENEDILAGPHFLTHLQRAVWGLGSRSVKIEIRIRGEGIQFVNECPLKDSTNVCVCVCVCVCVGGCVCLCVCV